MKSQGYVAIITVIVIASVALAVSSTVSKLAIGEAQSSLALTKGEDNLVFVEGCAEDALLKSRDAIYPGGNIDRPEGTCTVSVNKNGDNWTLTVSNDTSSSNTYYKRTILLDITRGPVNIAINSWKEI
ncbi:hypothetical protein HY407_04910 [Candidatus Gottesmanbacteria bacterium]|nr:hypothetical protein [Candidatus Gottesmanbacteria bacterium]